MMRKYQKKSVPLPTWAFEDIAWVAGLLEGEGWFGIKEKYKDSVYFSIHVTSVDRDVLEKLQHIIGAGGINGPYTNNARNQPHYTWALGRQEHVERLMKAVYPFMGVRRAEKIEQLLEI